MSKENPVVNVDYKVEVPRADWIEFLCDHNDIFMRDYIGYWARGVKHHKHKWLVWEFEMDNRKLPEGYTYIDSMPSELEDKHHKDALEAFKKGEKLPPHYHILDEAMAIKAFKAGVEKWGLDWFENGDANTYDYVMQQAMLGEQRYA